MAAVWVHTIWTTSASSISSLGWAASIVANAAFTAARPQLRIEAELSVRSEWRLDQPAVQIGLCRVMPLRRRRRPLRYRSYSV